MPIPNIMSHFQFDKGITQKLTAIPKVILLVGSERAAE
jgi:hypothetical protein